MQDDDNEDEVTVLLLFNPFLARVCHVSSCPGISCLHRTCNINLSEPLAIIVIMPSFPSSLSSCSLQRRDSSHESARCVYNQCSLSSSPSSSCIFSPLSRRHHQKSIREREELSASWLKRTRRTRWELRREVKASEKDNEEEAMSCTSISGPCMPLKITIKDSLQKRWQEGKRILMFTQDSRVRMLLSIHDSTQTPSHPTHQCLSAQMKEAEELVDQETEWRRWWSREKRFGRFEG